MGKPNGKGHTYHCRGTNRGVTRGEKGLQLPRRRNIAGAPKGPTNVASTYFNTVHLLPKDLRYEHGGPKFVVAPAASNLGTTLGQPDKPKKHNLINDGQYGCGRLY